MSTPPPTDAQLSLQARAAAIMLDKVAASRDAYRTDSIKLGRRARTAEAKVKRVEQLAERFETAFGHSGLAELIRRELRDNDE